MSGSFGFSGSAYNQVIVFQEEEHFITALETNPLMEPIIGATPDDRTNYPGVFIAGIRANSQMDK